MFDPIENKKRNIKIMERNEAANDMQMLDTDQWS